MVEASDNVIVVRTDWLINAIDDIINNVTEDIDCNGLIEDVINWAITYKHQIKDLDAYITRDNYGINLRRRILEELDDRLDPIKLYIKRRLIGEHSYLQSLVGMDVHCDKVLFLWKTNSIVIRMYHKDDYWSI